LSPAQPTQMSPVQEAAKQKVPSGHPAAQVWRHSPSNEHTPWIAQSASLVYGVPLNEHTPATMVVDVVVVVVVLVVVEHEHSPGGPWKPSAAGSATVSWGPP